KRARFRSSQSNATVLVIIAKIIGLKCPAMPANEIARHPTESGQKLRACGGASPLASHRVMAIQLSQHSTPSAKAGNIISDFCCGAKRTQVGTAMAEEKNTPTAN